MENVSAYKMSDQPYSERPANIVSGRPISGLSGNKVPLSFGLPHAPTLPSLLHKEPLIHPASFYVPFVSIYPAALALLQALLSLWSSRPARYALLTAGMYKYSVIGKSSLTLIREARTTKRC
jgi:hypothetical protein